MSAADFPSTLEALAALRDSGYHAASPSELESAEAAMGEGAALLGELVPRSGDALVHCLEVLDRDGLPALVRGGGSRLAAGNPLRSSAMLISMADLSGIDELDAADGVVCARAGTRLSSLAEAAREAGWELPLDTPGQSPTLGGALASATPNSPIAPGTSAVKIEKWSSSSESSAPGERTATSIATWVQTNRSRSPPMRRRLCSPLRAWTTAPAVNTSRVWVKAQLERCEIEARWAPQLVAIRMHASRLKPL